jgi:hypothetical protein
MQSGRSRKRRRRRIGRKYGVAIFIACAVCGVLGFVVFLMVMLTNPDWRPRE